MNIPDSEACKVCDLCYKLLLTDEELNELQRTIALSMNIQTTSNDKDTRFDNILFAKKPKIITDLGRNDESNRVKYKIQSLTQFRILFYFIRIYNLDVSTVEFNADTNYKLFIKVFDQKFSIPILEDKKKIISKEEIELNFAKIFYFFSSDVNVLKSILKNEVVDFRIVKNDNYDEPFAQCQTQCFFFFENETKTFRIKNIFNFFSDEIPFFKMQIYIGLTNDGDINTKKTILYNYRMLNNIYITEPNYYSFHPLPDDWHELFVPEGSDFKEIQQLNVNIIDSTINNIIENLGFNDVKSKENEDEDIYDPYNILVNMQKKKSTISKIKSIAMIQDKEPWEKIVERKKERPLTSTLVKEFKIQSGAPKQNKYESDSHTSSISELNNVKYSKFI